MANTDVEARLELIENALFPEYNEDECCGDPECALCLCDGSCEEPTTKDLGVALTALFEDGVFTAIEQLTYLAEHATSEEAAVAACNGLIATYMAAVDRTPQA